MFCPSRMRISWSTRATTATTSVTMCQARPSEDRVIPRRVRLAGPRAGDPRCASAGRAERLQLGRGASADDLLGEQPTGGRTEGDAPHPVATRRIHLRGAGRADERQAVGGAGPGAHPLVLTGVEVGTLEERTGGLGDRADPALVEACLGR